MYQNCSIDQNFELFYQLRSVPLHIEWKLSTFWQFWRNSEAFYKIIIIGTMSVLQTRDGRESAAVTHVHFGGPISKKVILDIIFFPLYRNNNALIFKIKVELSQPVALWPNRRGSNTCQFVHDVYGRPFGGVKPIRNVRILICPCL